ncbi:phosphate ABC transporter, periplasmic phosphate-binding protein, partial [mine drainage metagenome]
LLVGAAMAPLLAASIGFGVANAGQISLNETGSTLLFPLFNEWVPVYTHQHPNVKITTAGTGSGTGITDAINGTVQIGASDAYMATALMNNNPGMVNIPLAISAQQIMYNVPASTTSTSRSTARCSP